MGLFKRKNTEEENNMNVVKLSFVRNGELYYKNVEGFFMYDDQIFYKPKNGSGKNVKTNETFSDFYINKIGKSVPGKEISTVIVTDLIIN